MPFLRNLSLLVAVVACAAMWSSNGAAAVSKAKKQTDYGAAEARKVTQREEPWITADHSRHQALRRDFNSGPEVTEACLSCHNEAAEQFQKTIHWTWVCPADPKEVMGKNGLTMNNF